jgi:hypothetical protein
MDVPMDQGDARKNKDSSFQAAQGLWEKGARMSATPEMRRAERFLLVSLLGALLVIVVAHAVPLLNAPVMARQLRTQRELLAGLVRYERLLDALDESLRAVILSPDRPELRARELEARKAVLAQLDTLAESAPVGGPIPLELIDLATHFSRRVVAEAEDVKRNVAAPGNWALGRFRGRYARARAEHSARVQELVARTSLISDAALGASQSRIVASAGALLLAWGAALTFITVRARTRPDSLLIVPPPPTAHPAHLADVGGAGQGTPATAAASEHPAETVSHPRAEEIPAGTGPGVDGDFTSDPVPAPVVLELSTADMTAGVPGVSTATVEARTTLAAPENPSNEPPSQATPAVGGSQESNPPTEPVPDVAAAPGEVIDLGALFAEEAQKPQPAPIADAAGVIPATQSPSAEQPAPQEPAPAVLDPGALAPPDPLPVDPPVESQPAPHAAESPLPSTAIEATATASPPAPQPTPAPVAEMAAPQAGSPPETVAEPVASLPEASQAPEAARLPASDTGLVSSPTEGPFPELTPQTASSEVGSSADEPPVAIASSAEIDFAPGSSSGESDALKSGLPGMAQPEATGAAPLTPPLVGGARAEIASAVEPALSSLGTAASPPPSAVPGGVAVAADSPPPAAPAPTPENTQPDPTLRPAPRVEEPPSAASPVTTPAVPATPSEAKPAGKEATASRPRPDMRALMKDAKVMTADQLTAMLFGKGSDVAAKPQAGAAVDESPSTAPAATPSGTPPSPPRTITGGELAANPDPASGGDGKLDLSF